MMDGHAAGLHRNDEADSADLLVDDRTGQRGTWADWVDVFAQRWSAATSNPDDLMALLSPDVVLRSPGLKTTTGRAAGRQAFARTFSALPDLSAEVLSWAAAGDVLFIEMLFSATIGKDRVSWNNVDRFLFREGVAVEREAYFDPTPIRRAYLGSVSGLRQLWRMRKLR